MGDEQLLKQIASLAHCGELAFLSESEVLVAIRRLTVRHWNKERSVDSMTLSALDALRASKAVKTPNKD